MRLIERSFPYPVLGNRDDVPGAAFQATLEVSLDAEMAFLDVQIACSSGTISSLIAQRKAAFIIHVECSSTMYRSLYLSYDPAFRYAIPQEQLNGNVEANVVVIATDDIADYSIQGRNTEYGNHRFAIQKGDLLAIYPGQQFTVDRDYQSFENIDSIVTILSLAADSDGPMAVDLYDQKITIFLSRKDFQQYALLQNSALAPLLATTIVLPAITEAVRALKEDADEYDFRWARAIRRRREQSGKTFDDEPLSIAQDLLELPIRRALAAAVSAQGGDQ